MPFKQGKATQLCSSWAPELEVAACLNRRALRTSHLRLLFRWIDYSPFFCMYLVLQVDDSD